MTKEKFLSCVFSNEDQFTAATYQYINFNYTTLRKFIFHVPNEGAKSQKDGAKLKAMGVVAGIPDFVCVNPLFGLELKMPDRRNKKNGGLSDDQILIKEKWMNRNIPFCVAYTAEDVINFLTLISKP